MHFDHSARPQIEVVRIDKGTTRILELHQNEVLFFLEGRMQLGFRGFPEYEGIKGKILFLPAAHTYTYRALTRSVVLVFRLTETLQLCDGFHVEKLSMLRNRQIQNDYLPQTRKFSTLEINSHIWTFLDGLLAILNDGIRCRVFFEMKIREFFMMVRWYYPQEEICDFLYCIISADTVFSEHIRLHWRRYKNVAELADSMHMTPRQFSRKFVKVFATTPYKWMKEGKIRIIYRELTTTNKPYKYIAEEYGFRSSQQFAKYVKEALGKTPGQIRAEVSRPGKD